jgi:aspartyl-tRNA(Asn)/glutamyl-tRNA(Gln) amidotransferase subunit C
MSFTSLDVKKIAHLAKLSLSEIDLNIYTKELIQILDFVEQMNQIDTTIIKPLTSPLHSAQRLREDQVTEINQRDTFQAIAPLVEMGLYLVPKVIDGQ